MIVGSRRSHDGNGYGQQREIRKINWRDASDVHSFYFTRFPEDMNETNLWYEFKKWGDVREVFIARNRNKRGKRYRFVRFKGVKDVTWLERKLDNLVVGGLKMHVNVSKHGRERTSHGKASRGRRQEKGHGAANWNTKQRMEKTSYKLLEDTNSKGTLADTTGKQLQQMKETTLYVKVLMTNSKNLTRGRNLRNPSPTGSVSYSSVQLNIPMKEKTWLNNTWVGRLKNLALFDRMEDDLMWNGGDDITPKYIRDDMVLLIGLTETKAAQMVKEANEQGSSLFYSLEKSTPQLRTGYRLVWLLC